jgi:hypothetical protein
MGMQGFEARALDDDNLLFNNGFPTYETFSTPAGSASVTRARFVNNGTVGVHYITSPWVSGEVAGATRITPTTDVYWFHMYLQWSLQETNAYAGVGRNGTEGITLGVGTGGTVRLRAGDKGSLGESAESAPGIVASNTWYRFHVKVTHIAGGTVEVYLEGDLTTPILTYTLLAGDITNLGGKPNEFWWYADGITLMYVDDCFALDPADAIGVTDINLLANASIQPRSGLSAGTYSDWTGTVADVNEVPFSDVDFNSTGAINQAQTYNFPFAGQPAVHFVQSKLRMTRTGTAAGVQCQVRIRDNVGNEKDETITTAPGSGNIIQHHQTAPDGGAWDKSTFDGCQFGIVSRT